MLTEAEIAENARQTQAWVNRPRPRPTSPSPRQPDRSTHSNDADNIERQLLEDGHRTWGFVIYRTCYGNDEDWAEFLKRLKFKMEDTFDFFNGHDILELFTLTLIEDPEHLDGASTATVREHFQQWREKAPQTEQQMPQQQADADTENRPHLNQDSKISFMKIDKYGRLSPRYRYAIQVDAESLHSVVHDAPAPPEIDVTKKGWVKLIDASWQPVSTEDLDDTYEPIEGLIQRNVGWMKVPYKNVMSEYYVNARDLNWWVTSYQRPPIVMGYPYE